MIGLGDHLQNESIRFVFHVEFRMGPGCNSGLGIRTRPFDPARSRATRPSFFSYEIQLFDDAGKPVTTHSSGRSIATWRREKTRSAPPESGTAST